MQNLSENNTEISDVTQFFDGQHVLITGGSGFLGKLIIDKLLRSCPNIGKLYMLMRAKKGKTPDDRFKEHFDDVLYNRLKQEQPYFKNKVVLIEGDTSASNLDLSDIDRKRLIKNLNIVFHGAATVRFDETVRRVVNINVRGTKQVLQLAKEAKNLKAFVHISTAFSNCIQENIEEKFYDPPTDPDLVMKLVDILDDDMLKHMEPKLLGKWPNTYAFSKALGEAIVRKNSALMPVTIVRPAIVIATYKDPIPGWINNYYGPTGVVFGSGIGVLRTLHCEKKNIADIIPADYVVNEIIVAAWDVAKQFEVKQKEFREEGEKVEKKEDIIIYNSVSSCQNPIKWGEFMRLNEKYLPEVSSILMIWHYLLILEKRLWLYNILCFLLHTVPAAIVDTAIMAAGRKPMLMDGYKKIHKFSAVISYFATQQWNFNNKNTLALWDRTSPVDKNIFYFNVESLDWDSYMFHHVRGIRQYLAKDPLETLEAGRVKQRRLKIAHYILTTLIMSLLVWGLFNFLRFLITSLLVYTS